MLLIVTQGGSIEADLAVAHCASRQSLALAGIDYECKVVCIMYGKFKDNIRYIYVQKGIY